jgi:hypothetical protein
MGTVDQNCHHSDWAITQYARRFGSDMWQMYVFGIASYNFMPPPRNKVERQDNCIRIVSFRGGSELLPSSATRKPALSIAMPAAASNFAGGPGEAVICMSWCLATGLW